MVQKNTAISETVVKVSGGYRFCIVNDCAAPEDIRNFERPGMMAVKLWGTKISREHHVSFVNDLDDPTSAPFCW
jgi:hypothetical protein